MRPCGPEICGAMTWRLCALRPSPTRDAAGAVPRGAWVSGASGSRGARVSCASRRPRVQGLRAVWRCCGLSSTVGCRRPSRSRRTGRQACAKPSTVGGRGPCGGGVGGRRGPTGPRQCPSKRGRPAQRWGRTGGRHRRLPQASGASSGGWPRTTGPYQRPGGVSLPRPRRAGLSAQSHRGRGRTCGRHSWPRSWHMSTIPTARILCQPAVKRAPPKPPGRAVPNAGPIPPGTKGAQSIWRSSPPRPRGCATWHSLSSQPPHTMTPTPCLCGKPCPGLARCSAASGSMPSTRSTASPGGRMVVPRATWSHGPGHPSVHVRARPAPPSATRSSHGPFRQPPSCASEPIRQPSNPSPAWRKNLTKARPAPSWPKRSRARSMPYSHARWLARGRCAANEQGGERRSLAPPWPPMGCAYQRRPRVLQARRPCTPRRLEVPRPCALHFDWPSARAPV